MSAKKIKSATHVFYQDFAKENDLDIRTNKEFVKIKIKLYNDRLTTFFKYKHFTERYGLTSTEILKYKVDNSRSFTNGGHISKQDENVRVYKQIDKENNEYFFGIDSIVIEHPGCL